MSYVEKHMKEALVDHILEPAKGNNPEALRYRMVKPGTNMFSVYLAEVANSICLNGDLCVGYNGVVSASGYELGWFSGRLSEGYLCSKFLRQEWQWEAAVEVIEWQIKEAKEENYDMADSWWLENADKCRKFIKDPEWRYDTPTQWEFYEFMTELGDDGTELPGYDYPRIDAGWLCAIQQRYAELAKGLTNG